MTKPALSATTNLYHYGKTAVIEKTSKVPEPAEGRKNVIASEAKQSNAFLLKALVAIFNSNLVKLWIWYNCPELMGGTREIRKAYFENLRIPLNNTELLHQLATLADQIIEVKKTGEDTIELETQVNEIVYGLYGVTDQDEIEAVEKR